MLNLAYFLHLDRERSAKAYTGLSKSLFLLIMFRPSGESMSWSGGKPLLLLLELTVDMVPSLPRDMTDRRLLLRSGLVLTVGRIRGNVLGPSTICWDNDPTLLGNVPNRPSITEADFLTSDHVISITNRNYFTGKSNILNLCNKYFKHVVK